MNKAKLKEAEEKFLMRYPGGLSHPLMLEMAKKHKVEKMKKLALESFAIGQFENPEGIVEAIGRIVGQSSIISIFEKVKFRDFIKAVSDNEKERLSLGMKEFLHGDQELGFKLMSEVLDLYKLANWPLLTVCPIYFRPESEVFIKPTTAKNIIAHFELEGLKYSSNPTFAFYRAYREQINRMKRDLDISLQYDNAAFCGFLMMSMEDFAPTK